MIFTLMCVQHTKYSIERRQCEDNYGEKITMFSCRFKTSSDKLQNVSQSVNVSSLETVCLATVKW